MKKILLSIAIAGTLAAGIITFKRFSQTVPSHRFTIGILQTASHPALDAVRNGFMEELERIMTDEVHCLVRNAQGSVSQAHALAQQLHTDSRLTGFFAIATPAAQALGAVEKTRPVIIAAVTDPRGLGLLQPNGNVTGVTDMIDVDAQVAMLTQLLPNAKTVALLYTSGETNSVTMVKQMRTALEKQGLITLDCPVAGEADMASIVEFACRKADAILAPSDNTVASSITLITSIAAKYKKPFIASDNMLVEFGALAARGVDYEGSGKQAARMLYELLVENKQPSQLPVEQASCDQVMINENTLDALGLTIPPTLQGKAVLVRNITH